MSNDNEKAQAEQNARDASFSASRRARKAKLAQQAQAYKPAVSAVGSSHTGSRDNLGLPMTYEELTTSVSHLPAQQQRAILQQAASSDMLNTSHEGMMENILNDRVEVLHSKLENKRESVMQQQEMGSSPEAAVIAKLANKEHLNLSQVQSTLMYGDTYTKLTTGTAEEREHARHQVTHNAQYPGEIQGAGVQATQSLWNTILGDDSASKLSERLDPHKIMLNINAQIGGATHVQGMTPRRDSDSSAYDPMGNLYESLMYRQEAEETFIPKWGDLSPQGQLQARVSSATSHSDVLNADLIGHGGVLDSGNKAVDQFDAMSQSIYKLQDVYGEKMGTPLHNAMHAGLTTFLPQHMKNVGKFNADAAGAGSSAKDFISLIGGLPALDGSNPEFTKAVTDAYRADFVKTNKRAMSRADHESLTAELEGLSTPKNYRKVLTEEYKAIEAHTGQRMTPEERSKLVTHKMDALKHEYNEINRFSKSEASLSAPRDQGAAELRNYEDEVARHIADDDIASRVASINPGREDMYEFSVLNPVRELSQKIMDEEGWDRSDIKHQLLTKGMKGYLGSDFITQNLANPDAKLLKFAGKKEGWVENEATFNEHSFWGNPLKANDSWKPNSKQEWIQDGAGTLSLPREDHSWANWEEKREARKADKIIPPKSALSKDERDRIREENESIERVYTEPTNTTKFGGGEFTYEGKSEETSMKDIIKKLSRESEVATDADLEKLADAINAEAGEQAESPQNKVKRPIAKSYTPEDISTTASWSATVDTTAQENTNPFTTQSQSRTSGRRSLGAIGQTIVTDTTPEQAEKNWLDADDKRTILAREGSDEWLSERKRYMTSSRAGGSGDSSGMSNDEAISSLKNTLEEAVGRKAPFKGNTATDAGHSIETELIDRYRKEVDSGAFTPGLVKSDAGGEYNASTADLISSDGNRVIEFKSRDRLPDISDHARQNGMYYKEDKKLFDKHSLQAQHQMWVNKADDATLIYGARSAGAAHRAVDAESYSFKRDQDIIDRNSKRWEAAGQLHRAISETDTEGKESILNLLSEGTKEGVIEAFNVMREKNPNLLESETAQALEASMGFNKTGNPLKNRKEGGGGGGGGGGDDSSYARALGGMSAGTGVLDYGKAALTATDQGRKKNMLLNAGQAVVDTTLWFNDKQQSLGSMAAITGSDTTSDLIDSTVSMGQSNFMDYDAAQQAQLTVADIQAGASVGEGSALQQMIVQSHGMVDASMVMAGASAEEIAEDAVKNALRHTGGDTKKASFLLKGVPGAVELLGKQHASDRQVTVNSTTVSGAGVRDKTTTGDDSIEGKIFNTIMGTKDLSEAGSELFDWGTDKLKQGANHLWDKYGFGDGLSEEAAGKVDGSRPGLDVNVKVQLDKKGDFKLVESEQRESSKDSY